MPQIDLLDAQHEAAHVVVGLALGLKLKRAFVRRVFVPEFGFEVDGLVYFGGFKRRKLSVGVMACAGIYWERKIEREGFEYADLKLARLCLGGVHDVASGVKLAGEVLGARRALHTRIASALCDGDLTARDIQALVLDP